MSKQTKHPKVTILGVEVDAVTIPEAIDYIAGRVAGAAGYVIKPYVEFLDQAAGRQELINLLNRADLSLADGIAVNWAAYYLAGQPGFGRWLTSLIKILVQPRAILNPLPGRIGGLNFTLPLLDYCQKSEVRVFLIGSPRHQPIDQTARFMQSKFPSLNLVGSFKGYLNPADETELIQQLRTARPDLILVGSSFPRQEQLMARLCEQLDHGIFVGEGGSFDYRQLGGRSPRAPRLVQAINLEWLWRLLLQPTRLKRQLAIPRFIWRIYLAGRR